MSKAVMTALVSATQNPTLQNQNVRPYVHIGVWQDAIDALQAGATIISHLGETKLDESDPNPATAATAKALFQELDKHQNLYFIPTISLYQGVTSIQADNKTPDHKLLNDPLLAKVTEPSIINSYRSADWHQNNGDCTGPLDIDPDYQDFLSRHSFDGYNVKKLKDHGVKIMAGTDTVEVGTFPGWSLHRELVLLVQARLSKYEALASATTIPGDFWGRNFSLDPGGEGNVVVLDASPIDGDIWNTTQINMVIHHGQIIPYKQEWDTPSTPQSCASPSSPPGTSAQASGSDSPTDGSGTSAQAAQSFTPGDPCAELSAASTQPLPVGFANNLTPDQLANFCQQDPANQVDCTTIAAGVLTSDIGTISNNIANQAYCSLTQAGSASLRLR